MDFLELLDKIDDIIWGAPLLILLVGTGILLTFRLQFLQIRRLPTALKLIFTARNEGSGDISSFGALCTALAATVGTGNIVGVATAIKAGGPGALFWMWVAAFFGMATKYAEGLLAVKYRTRDARGQISGGPMYYIVNGLGPRFQPLAAFFAIGGIMVALFGIGTFPQVNAIVESVKGSAGIPNWIAGAVVTILVAVIILGGLKRITQTSEKVVPFMSSMYIITCIIIIFFFRDRLGDTINLVIKSAFTGTAAAGGFLGATVRMSVRNGIARGVFSNEAGLGSAPIVAAAAKTKWPAEQGLISMTGTFIDTIVICTLTGLSLIVSGVWQGESAGAAMTQDAFNTVLPGAGPAILTFSLALFAFTTIIGWSYYGERCCEYLFGVNAIFPYRVVFILMVGISPFLKLEVIWLIADIVNGLMAIPNLIALVALSKVVVCETKLYLNYIKAKR